MVPMTWKLSCIVPVPKKQSLKPMNGLCPVALTSCVMKAFDRVLFVHLQQQAAAFMGSFQFAYRNNGSVDEAILHLLPFGKTWHTHPPNVLPFLQCFNTIQPHLLSEKLLNMNIHASTWI